MMKVFKGNKLMPAQDHNPNFASTDSDNSYDHQDGMVEVVPVSQEIVKGDMPMLQGSAASWLHSRQVLAYDPRGYKPAISRG